MSQSFNINAYSQRFVTNILQVSLKLQRIANVINGIWDVINDVLFGAIVDKTRTRWGKFKPYLVALGIPGTIGTCIYWLMPLIFAGRGPNDIWKFIGYLLLMVSAVKRGNIPRYRTEGYPVHDNPAPCLTERELSLLQTLPPASSERSCPSR